MIRTLIAAVALSLFSFTAHAQHLEVGAYASWPDEVDGAVPYGFHLTYVTSMSLQGGITPVLEVSKTSISKHGPVGQGLAGTAGARWNVTDQIFVQATAGLQGVANDMMKVSEKLSYQATAGWRVGNVGLRLNYGGHGGFKDAHVSTGVFFSF